METITRKKRFQLLLAMLLAATFSVAQQTVIVKDSITNEPISFVSVYLGNNSGGYTDEKGAIAIPNEAAQIHLSHICYETKSITIVPADSQTIFLVPKSITLDEVAVSAKAPKRIKTTEVGLRKAKTQTKHKGANGFEMALFIPYDSTWTKTLYIHSILANLDYSTHYLAFTEIKNPIYATLRFDLRLPDAKTGAPKDESLIDGGIILPSGQKLNKDGISLPRPIPFPQTGVFVVVEWITTARVSESYNLVPSLNMTLNEKENKTWNKKTFRGMDWIQEQNEPAYQNKETQVFYKGRMPSAKLGLKISQ
ncbi:MAG: hypothetical protein IKN86_04810 [Bacteroidaceae bacterium]|nr:hypothetical protein [Bacteroidaceae bacterium]